MADGAETGENGVFIIQMKNGNSLKEGAKEWIEKCGR